MKMAANEWGRFQVGGLPKSECERFVLYRHLTIIKDALNNIVTPANGGVPVLDFAGFRHSPERRQCICSASR